MTPPTAQPDLWAEYHRTYRALGQLLTEYADPSHETCLPIIKWTVELDPASRCLHGTVPQFASWTEAWDPRKVFEAWRTTLRIPEFRVFVHPNTGQVIFEAYATDWRPELVGNGINVLLTLDIDASDSDDSFLIYQQPSSNNPEAATAQRDAHATQ